MKRIPLTKGKEALVDDQDYSYLMQWKWHAAKGGKYAARDTRSFNRQYGSVVYMHDVLAARNGIAGKIDHANQDTLDNQRQNLRPATGSQNGANRGPQANNTSGYKGVVQVCQRWRAQIKVKGEFHSLGHFPLTDAGKIKAARVYNEAALKHFGEFAVLNPV